MSVQVTKDGPVWTVLIDRPRVKNAVDRPTADALARAFEAFEQDATAHAAVLAGAHGTFCAGADLQAIAQGQGNRLDANGDGPMGPTRMQLSKPVIAAVQGHAVGGGFELALWCDLRIMEEDARLGFLNRRWGVPLVDGGTVRLPRLIGLSRALDLILTGREVRAPEAHAIGLVHRVVPRGQAVEAAQALAREIAAFPPLAMRGDRASAHAQSGLSLEAALRNEFAAGQAALADETARGAAAFVARPREKKPS